MSIRRVIVRAGKREESELRFLEQLGLYIPGEEFYLQAGSRYEDPRPILRFQLFPRSPLLSIVYTRSLASALKYGPYSLVHFLLPISFEVNHPHASPGRP